MLLIYIVNIKSIVLLSESLDFPCFVCLVNKYVSWYFCHPQTCPVLEKWVDERDWRKYFKTDPSLWNSMSELNSEEEPTDNSSQKQGVASACVPCSINHFSTSARLLNEAVRFKKDGLTSPQVLDDISAVLGEQNALERIDLTPEKIQRLPDWEKQMAQLALDKSRELRHMLEGIQSMEELETLAAGTEEFYKYLNREWLSKRLENCPTCKIKAETEKQEEAPNLDEYGKSVSEKRRKFLEEISGVVG